MIERSFIIPVIDFSPKSPYNILTLLDDLEAIKGEVICVFNSEETFQRLRSHPRIDKYCHCNLNVGVSRAWNIGINMAEGASAFVLSQDLHLGRAGLERLEKYLFSLEGAVLIGPQGSHIDYPRMKLIRYFEKGSFSDITQVNDVSGFYFGIHMQRYLAAKLCFDVRYTPCFFEEWDMALQVFQAGLAAYVVPINDFDHQWGTSAKTASNEVINYFKHAERHHDILERNKDAFKRKWAPLIFSALPKKK